MRSQLFQAERISRPEPMLAERISRPCSGLQRRLFSINIGSQQASDRVKNSADHMASQEIHLVVQRRLPSGIYAYLPSDSMKSVDDHLQPYNP